MARTTYRSREQDTFYMNIMRLAGESGLLEGPDVHVRAVACKEHGSHSGGGVAVMDIAVRRAGRKSTSLYRITNGSVAGALVRIRGREALGMTVEDRNLIVKCDSAIPGFNGLDDKTAKRLAARIVEVAAFGTTVPEQLTV
jgi:hypothetical protein